MYFSTLQGCIPYLFPRFRDTHHADTNHWHEVCRVPLPTSASGNRREDINVSFVFVCFVVQGHCCVHLRAFAVVS